MISLQVIEISDRQTSNLLSLLDFTRFQGNVITMGPREDISIWDDINQLLFNVI